MPPENNAPLPPELANNQEDGPNGDILRSLGWLCGFRVDDVDEPELSARQIAMCVDGARPSFKEVDNISTEIITTHTIRESNYAHCGWSIGAIGTISPWTASRIAATNQQNKAGTYYTRLTKTKRLKIQVSLEDLAPAPEFEAAIEEALGLSTTFEKFQAIYRVLDRWVDDSQQQLIKVSKVARTISLLSGELQMQLSDLYTQRLSYVPPYTIGPIHYWYRTYDDNEYSSKTILSITIRSSDYIELLSVTYSDGTTSLKHGGSGHVGTEYKFALAPGEHITEMLTWIEGDWVHGLQFITNMGRCSAQYGAHHGAPTISRPRGGVLVGFSSQTKLHPEYKEMFTGLQGIWRHDIIPRAPKEDDVFSEYFGDKRQNGRIFNDRVLVRNSGSIRISGVEVWSGVFIDGIRFTYTDNKDGREIKSSTVQRGRPGGSFHRFDLEDGEHIVTVSGRASEVFGGGKGQSFSSLAPRDRNGNSFRLLYICGKRDSNNNPYPNPPEPDVDPDILASTSLKDFDHKDALLRNIGYLYGIRVDDNDGPQSVTRQVARFVGASSPLVQEMNDFFTETISTTTERDTNYVHRGWSIGAASTISPWTSFRIGANNQPNAGGTWLTRRTLVKRFSVQVSLTDLAPVVEFKNEIEAALRKPTLFQKFEAVYRALDEWGDVVPLKIDMGASLAFTDLETNMSQLPATANWHDTHYLATIRTGRTTRQEGTDHLYWKPDIWPQRIISPLNWRQIRITKVAPTTELLPPELQEKLFLLYASRLSYVPAITIGPGDSSGRTRDDTPYASKQISSVIIYASDWIRSMRFTYTDKTSSIKHQGTEKYGSEHEFVLTKGEYITEMLVWRSDWVCGLQFITSFGRCSPHFGGNGHTVAVERIKGGVLVGVLSLIQQQSPGNGDLFRQIQGIWRHDVFNKVPKEDDMISEYFGSKDKGRPFNDRVIVRNSDMAISQIEVRCGSAIDSLQFTYVDSTNPGRGKFLTDRHGGIGGDKKPPFVLGPGEHIFSISGRYDDNQITQLIFVTNKGRTSDVFGAGQSNGKAYVFSVSSPEDNSGELLGSGSLYAQDNMNAGRAALADDSGDNNAPIPPGFAPRGIDQMLRRNGWLCGFRVDDMDEPQVSAHQVASYVDGAIPFIQELNSVHTEFITTHDQRAANYVHHGWSVGAVETISPWTLSRIDAKNRHNPKGDWIARRTLARRLRVQVLLEDLSPVPEFEAAIEEALRQPSTYERFRAVYHAMSRWGDVIPLGMEMGCSLTLTDKEANFNQGAASSTGWEDGRSILKDVPTTEWRPIRIVAVAPTFSLLADNIQIQLANLYNERLSYVPPLTIDPICYQWQILDDTNNASRTISKIKLYTTDYIDYFVVEYLDGVAGQDSKDEGNKHTFTLTNGEHIIEMLTCTDDDWLRGVQFITNKGRCSAIYGVLEGTPVVVRSKGGILAGLSVTSRKHPQWAYLVTSIRVSVPNTAVDEST
ncbi:unnamed protein product [Rhizoctonia solani]|uniref:Jacalin-type lectin domain-containing protein n=1 Tax=Rhizoctonia solani TaxID=456999 RepID=A0A8H2W869_9AGAM|nr:unnamed protein product [Rhizoctonia solani]